MSKIEVQNNNLDWMVPILALSVRMPQEQKLLMAPEENASTRINFDSVLEAGYLSHLPPEIRLSQLKKEVVTTLSELKFAEVSAKYEFINGRIIDVDTRLDLEELIAKGNIPAETRAIKKLNELLKDDSLVINISPYDDYLNYLDNVVDIWKKYSDGKIKVLRYRVVGDLNTLKNFYKDIGGEIVNPTKDEILGDPVQIKNLKLSDIMDLLVVEKCEERFGSKDVDRIAGAIMKDFNRTFGDKLTRDPNVILRYYLAVKDAVEKLDKNSSKFEIHDAVSRVILEMPMDRYLHASFTTKTEGGSHCGAGIGGEFGSGQGWILVVVDGQMTSYFGSTEGMSHCSRCGCYHSGDKCPFCDLGYAATC